MVTPASSGSVIVPAHNEAATISRGLTELMSGTSLVNIHVVVACNGCTDETAAVARAVPAPTGGWFDVLEIEQASKVEAIRAAERTVGPGPRLYLDADARCPGRTARALLDAVAAGRADIAVPRRDLDTSSAGWAARAYHQAWSDLPWVQRQLSGRAAYALSERLRATFGLFPDVVADDRWATTRPTVGGTAVVDEPVVVVPAPGLREVLVARTRIYAGNRSAEVPTHDAGIAQRLKGLVVAGLRPQRWLGLLIFVSVNGMAKLRASGVVTNGGPQWRSDTRR